MKKILILLGLFIQTFHCIAQNSEKIHWMSFKEAMEKGSTTPKKVFIDVYTGWCGWCKRMDASTFSDSDVVKYINQNFYAVKLDAETKEVIKYKDKSYSYVAEYKSNELAALLLNGQMSYPTTVYLNEKLEIIGPVQGYLKKEQLLPVLKYFSEDEYVTKKWDDFLKDTFQ